MCSRHPTALALPARRASAERGQAVGVAEGRDHVGLVLEGLGEEPTGAEDDAKPAGHLRRLPEGDGQFGRLLVAGREDPQAEEPEVGIGRLGQPAEEQRKHLLHQPRRSGQPAGQLVEGLAGAGGVGETEGGQAGGGRVGREQGGAGVGRWGGAGGEGFQQRAEEKVLVDGADDGLLAGEVGGEQAAGAGLGRVPVAHDPGQSVHGVATRRQGVDRLFGHELQSVLDGPEQPVGVVQRPGVGGVDVAARPQLAQRLEGGGGAERGVVATVDELQELDGELDVADAAAAPFYLPVGEAPAGQFALGPGLHGPDGPQVLGAERPAPQPSLGLLQEAPAQIRVAGDGARLQQGLELPRVGPPVPIGLVGVEGSDQRPVAALGPQVDVDPEAGAGHVEHGPGCPGLLGDAGPDEDDVDVARIVQLRAPQLAHADDGEAVGAGRVDSPLQHLARHAGQRVAHHRQVVKAHQVPSRHAQQLQPLPAAQVADPGEGGPGVEVGQHVDGRRIGEQQLGEGPAGCGHCDQRAPQGDVHLEAGAEGRVGLGQPFEGHADRSGGGRVLDGDRQPHVGSLPAGRDDNPSGWAGGHAGLAVRRR